MVYLITRDLHCIVWWWRVNGLCTLLLFLGLYVSTYVTWRNGMTLKKVTVTQGEIQDAMKHNVYKNKKKYTRKHKHKQDPGKESGSNTH
tara:strand:- start:279 stop:545 length:267 start_codon:yes stop_codon:yes gene_type:complete